MAKKCIATDKAPKAIGPYSQANVLTSGKLVFCAGQIAIDPETGNLIDGDVAAQTERALKNVQAVLEAADSSLAQVVKVTLYLRNINDFKAVNEVYGKFFRNTPPARAAVEISGLPMDAAVEIDAIAFTE